MSFKPNCNSEVIKYSDCNDIIVLSKILLEILDNARALYLHELDKFSLVFLGMGITLPCKKLLGAYP